MTHRIPTPAEFARLSVSDQWQILDWHLNQIETEIAGIKEGSITGRGGKHYLLKLARARMKRLEKLAHDFGYWTDDKAKAA